MSQKDLDTLIEQSMPNPGSCMSDQNYIDGRSLFIAYTVDSYSYTSYNSHDQFSGLKFRACMHARLQFQNNKVTELETKLSNLKNKSNNLEGSNESIMDNNEDQHTVLCTQILATSF